MTSATAAGGVKPPAAPKSRKSVTGTRRTVAALFLLPALVLLGALVVYPIGYSVVRSFYDQSGDGFAGIDNYEALFTEEGIRTALKNNIIWVVLGTVAPIVIGLAAHPLPLGARRKARGQGAHPHGRRFQP